jgi:hypothetical protein
MRQQEDAEVSGQFAGTNMVASQYPSTYTLWTLRLHHPKLDIFREDRRKAAPKFPRTLVIGSLSTCSVTSCFLTFTS